MVHINGLIWKIEFTDNEQDLLVDEVVRLGVTDRNEQKIYLYNGLYGKELRKVLIHELTHAWLFSYGYRLDREIEEMLCSFLDSHAEDILLKADFLME